MSVMRGLHLMRFGWRSVPLVAKNGPCMALVLQGTKSVEFWKKHLKSFAETSRRPVPNRDNEGAGVPHSRFPTQTTRRVHRLSAILLRG
jgi:hypothetical protein